MKNAHEAAEHWEAERERATPDWARAVSGYSAPQMTDEEWRVKKRELKKIVRDAWRRWQAVGERRT